MRGTRPLSRAALLSACPWWSRLRGTSFPSSSLRSSWEASAGEVALLLLPLLALLLLLLLLALLLARTGLPVKPVFTCQAEGSGSSASRAVGLYRRFEKSFGSHESSTVG